ncbi:bifunctional folylpolyglutamate synthase/dihydrofolate synthase [Methyloradius palustris]|uniref:Dihydrofolate synthase/folylpolyglutamate synthase n=2 Tax=Methyloradius palustris TaxID=2778876 RepID=A0A8D5GAW2_9PROT|nr:bifunctional folylpolyglutamate synthase/dihydrofolate synthase [Methyloradius palustris]
MGLDRVNSVKQRLNLTKKFPIIIVGGTNGKGSTCAMLERVYSAAGYRVACYTSPHLLAYNERVRVAEKNASDQDLCSAFAAVEAARQDTELTYFEFATLAAYWHFTQSTIDIAVLEVGLGGRLDAVNVFDPDCTIVTSIDLDHMDFLGNNRESIAYEKAGIFRKGITAICGEPNPPHTLIEHAEKIQADLKLINQDFSFQSKGQSWIYSDLLEEVTDLPFPALAGDFQLYNAACVIAAVHAMQDQLFVPIDHIIEGLKTVGLAGRFQKFNQQRTVILDVAHNPHAAAGLALNLSQNACKGRTLGVFAMLADKDVSGVVEILNSKIDVWYLAGINQKRGATAQQLQAIVQEQSSSAEVHNFVDTTAAYRQACIDATENDRIVVFGSFFTVADVMRMLPSAS